MDINYLVFWNQRRILNLNIMKELKQKRQKKRWFYSTSIFVILFIVEKQNSLLYCVFYFFKILKVINFQMNLILLLKK